MRPRCETPWSVPPPRIASRLTSTAGQEPDFCVSIGVCQLPASCAAISYIAIVIAQIYIAHLSGNADLIGHSSLSIIGKMDLRRNFMLVGLTSWNEHVAATAVIEICACRLISAKNNNILVQSTIRLRGSKRKKINGTIAGDFIQPDDLDELDMTGLTKRKL